MEEKNLRQLIKDQTEESNKCLEAAIYEQAKELKWHFDSAIGELYRKTDDLKEGLEYSQKEINVLKNELAQQKQHHEEKDNQMILEMNAFEMKKQLTYLENQSRRNKQWDAREMPKVQGQSTPVKCVK